jgi:hypothetical protein
MELSVHDESEKPHALVCTEVWRGNRRVSGLVKLLSLMAAQCRQVSMGPSHPAKIDSQYLFRPLGRRVATGCHGWTDSTKDRDPVGQ